jgi:hypothetical protein
MPSPKKAATKSKKIEFDHKAPVTEVTDPGNKHLIQNGRKWTNAEWNHYAEKWEPQPKLLDLLQQSQLKVKPVLEEVMVKLDEIKTLLDPLSVDLERIRETETDAKQDKG